MLWLAVALGGSLGAMARYACYLLWGSQLKGFPMTTFVINVIGSLLIGVAYVLVVQAAMLSGIWRQFFIVGFLGSFTTFSTFSLETLRLLEQGHLFFALSYLVASLIFGLLAAYLGVTITERML